MLPINVAIQEKRRYPRIDMSLPVNFRLKNRTITYRSLTKDLNRKGLRLIANDFLPKKSSILLELEIKELPQILNLAGEVAWVRSLKFSQRYQVGVEFVNLDKKSEAMLDEYAQLKASL